MRVCITASLVCCLCMCWFRNRLTSLFPCLPLLPSHSRWPGRVKNETGGIARLCVCRFMTFSRQTTASTVHYTALWDEISRKQSSHNISHKMVYVFYYVIVILFHLFNNVVIAIVLQCLDKPC